VASRVYERGMRIVGANGGHAAMAAAVPLGVVR
jgi:hypothetical protein